MLKMLKLQLLTATSYYLLLLTTTYDYLRLLTTTYYYLLLLTTTWGGGQWDCPNILAMGRSN